MEDDDTVRSLGCSGRLQQSLCRMKRRESNSRLFFKSLNVHKSSGFSISELYR